MVPRKFANMTFSIDVQTEQFLWAFVDCWTTLKYIFLNVKIWRVSTICTRWSMSCCVIRTLTSWRWTAMVWPRRSWPVPTSRTSLQCSSKSSSRPENHFSGSEKPKNKLIQSSVLWFCLHLTDSIRKHANFQSPADHWLSISCTGYTL